MANRKSHTPDLSTEQRRSLHRWMRLGRLLDERLLKLQRQGRIAFYGTATGEEAAVAGSAFALSPDDWIFPALRQGLAALMRGMPLDAYIAQCIGNAKDVAKGRQMPVHYAYRAANFVSWSSCIATQLPHAVGMAYAARLKRHERVALAYLGDGATSEGDFHVAMNFAGVYRLPVVFFCQNNQWAISVPIERQTASANIAAKAAAYGFHGTRIDGNDVLEVYRATRKAVLKARAGQGPTLIEAVTYRVGSHSSSDDPTRYRDPAEHEARSAKDPISAYREKLIADAIWDPDRELQLTQALDQQITRAIRAAENAPSLPPHTLFTDVFAQPPASLTKQQSQRT